MPTRTRSRQRSDGRTTSRAGTRAGGRSTAARAPAAPRRQTLSPGISRVDQPTTRTHGYVVRVDYRRTDRGWRPQHTSFFGDATHGGRRKALAAAEEWLAALRRPKRSTSAAVRKRSTRAAR